MIKWFCIFSADEHNFNSNVLAELILCDSAHDFYTDDQVINDHLKDYIEIEINSILTDYQKVYKTNICPYRIS